MPRFGSKSRTSISTAASSYDLTTTFTSFTGEFVYDKGDSLLLWGNLCNPKPFVSEHSYTVPANMQLVGYDMAPGTRYGLYSPSSMPAPPHTPTTEFCGDKCYFPFSGIGIPLSGGESSGTAYASGQHFFTLDHDNFTFNTGGQDQPFSISLWYESTVANSGGSLASPTGPISYLINKPLEYGLAISGDNKLRFTLNSGGSSTNTIFVESSANPMSTSDWNHVLITYDGSEAAAGMKIYVNGEDVTASVGGLGSYTGMTNLNGHVYFGYGSIAGTSLPLQSFATEGAKILEPAIWSKELSKENVKAVYHATETCILLNSDVEVFRGESGYTSKPPRVLLRDLDNHPGTYHTVHRMGDRDRTGKYSIQYDDTSAINFDKKIVDEFLNRDPFGIKNNNINSKLWDHSSGLEIRRETLVGFNGSTFEDGVLVFTGGSPRFLQTKEKVRNATIELELVQGPHNKNNNMFGTALGLNLDAGAITETLRVQVSTDGSAWTTIKTFTPSDLITFYQVPTNPGGTGGTTSGLVRELRSDLFGGVSNRFRKKIKLSTAQIEAHGPGASYYIRLYQDTVAGSDPNKAVWGLGRIEINYFDRQVNYPLLTDLSTTVGKKIAEKRIVTPHTRSDITTVGRTISGVTDSHLTFSPGEAITPFDETLAIESLDITNLFSAVGTETEVHPGFTSPLSSKTKFVIDLGTNNSEYFGYTTSNTQSPKGTNPQQPLMVYYNHTLKRWEPIAKGLQLNNGPNQKRQGIYDAVTSSAVGFGPIGHVISDGEVLDGGFMDSYARRINQFAFPVGGRYHSTSSQTLTGVDIGITKPFVLEKMVLETDIIFEFPDKNTTLDSLGFDGQRAFALKRHITAVGGSPPGIPPNATPQGTGSVGHFANDTLNFDFDTKLRYYLPTFFMLRQFESGHYSRDFRPRLNTTASISGRIESLRYGIDIPGMFDLDGDGVKETYVNTRREMIADGQLGILLSGSSGTSFDINTILANGLKREALYTIDENTTALTGTFKIEFRPRVHQSYRASTYLGVISEYGPSNPVSTGSILMELTPQSRVAQLSIDPLHNQRRLNKSSHPGYVDRFMTKEKGSKVPIPARTQSSHRLNGGFSAEFALGNRRAKERVTQDTPYLLFPEDQLIIGCQYPLAEDFPLFGTTQYNSFKNQMKFHGKARLHLYGSMIKNGREFHEYSNQNLNSENIHEIIGAETITDQFHLETRAELTGTYVDDFTAFRQKWKSPVNVDLLAFDKAPDHPVLRLEGQMIETGSLSGMTGHKRFPTRTRSRSGHYTQLKNYFSFEEHGAFDTFDHLGRYIPEGNKDVTGYVGEIPATQRFVMLKDQDRVFKDSYYGDNYFFGKSHKQSATSAVGDRLEIKGRNISSGYGTMQTEMLRYFYNSPSGGESTNGQSARSGSYGVKTISPKFYFNHRRFGYLSDMIRQGRDSAMFIIPATFRNNYYNPNGGVPGRITNVQFSQFTVTASLGGSDQVAGNPQPSLVLPFLPATALITPAGSIPTITSPAVAARIVTASVTGDSRLVIYPQVVNPSAISALSAPTLQSNPIHNTSPFQTSSMPYYDNAAGAHGSKDQGRASRHSNLNLLL